MGFSRNAIAWMVRVGRLYPVHRGVYAVGRPPVVPLEHAAAAVLACGSQAALSHQSGLALWENRSQWPEVLEVTVTMGRPGPRGIVVHRSRALARRDLTTQRGIRVTSPARTLLDCAPGLSDAQLLRAVNDARNRHIVKIGQLIDVLSRNPTHPGAKRLRRLVEGDRGPTRSEFEDRFRALCERHALPMPRFKQFVGGYEADAFFPEQGLIVELDSWTFHRDRGAFERDRLRDAEHLEHGLPTLRITWERLRDMPDREAARVQAILDRR